MLVFKGISCFCPHCRDVCWSRCCNSKFFTNVLCFCKRDPTGDLLCGFAFVTRFVLVVRKAGKGCSVFSDICCFSWSGAWVGGEVHVWHALFSHRGLAIERCLSVTLDSAWRRLWEACVFMERNLAIVAAYCDVVVCSFSSSSELVSFSTSPPPHH